MFNCNQAMETISCTAGKGVLEREKASVHVNASPDA